jgi:hypothetical protein
MDSVSIVVDTASYTASATQRASGLVACLGIGCFSFISRSGHLYCRDLHVRVKIGQSHLCKQSHCCDPPIAFENDCLALSITVDLDRLNVPELVGFAFPNC